MRLINKTKISRKKILNIIKFTGRGLDKLVKSICIKHLGTNSFGGFYDLKDDKINIIIGKRTWYPDFTCNQKDIKDGYIQIFVENQTEALIYLLSHEFRHVWQECASSQRWFSGKIIVHKDGLGTAMNCKKSEIDCDLFAQKMIEKYRKNPNLIK